MHETVRRFRLGRHKNRGRFLHASPEIGSALVDSSLRQSNRSAEICEKRPRDLVEGLFCTVDRQSNVLIETVVELCIQDVVRGRETEPQRSLQ